MLIYPKKKSDQKDAPVWKEDSFLRLRGLVDALVHKTDFKKTEDGKDHDGIINDLDDEFKKEIDKAVDQDAQTSEYLCVTCFEDGWPSSVLKQNKNVMAGRGKLKQKLIEACRFAQREK